AVALRRGRARRAAERLGRRAVRLEHLLIERARRGGVAGAEIQVREDDPAAGIAALAREDGVDLARQGERGRLRGGRRAAGARAEPLVGGVGYEGAERRQHLLPSLVAFAQREDPALEVAEARARGEGARAHLAVLGPGALAVAARAVQLGEEVARLGGALGPGIGGEVRVERLLVGRRERRVAGACDVEGAEAVVAGVARVPRVGDLAEEARGAR